MANPRELLHSAAESRRRRTVHEKVPVQALLPQSEPTVQPVRRSPGGHSAYSALMRSHDRVHPRIGR